MREDGALRHARGAAGVLQHRRRIRLRLGVGIARARRTAAGRLQHRETRKAPRRHRAPDARVDEIEQRALERGHEIAEPGHHHVPDLRLGDDRFELVGEILHDDDDGRTGIGKLLFQFARRVQRIDVDDDQAGAQHREEDDRIGNEVRQHDADALARPAFRLLDEESRKGAAGAFPLGVAHARVQAFERRASGMAHARIEQHRRK